MFENENISNNYGITKSLVERFKNALEMNLKTQIKKVFSTLHPADQAELIYNLTKEERKKMMDILKGNIDPELLVELESDIRSEIANYLSSTTLANLVSKLDIEDAVEILEDLKDELTQDTIDSIKSEEKREDIEEALSYPEDSVGRIMNQTNFVAIPKDWQIAEVLKYIKKNKNVPQDFSNLVVVDEYFRPVSTASIGSVLKADSKNLISEVMRDPEALKIVNADMDQSEAANLFIKYDLKFIPIINHTGVLVGILNSNDIMHVINEETREDMLLMANVNADDTVYTNVLGSVKRRIPWLIITIMTASASTLVINHFAGTIQQFVILSAIMPLIANLSGVSGTQTLTILVRNISNNENRKTGLFKIISKETFVGFINGCLLSSITSTILFLWKGDLKLTLIFGTTIVALQTMSCFIASIVPLLIHKLKLDPAVGSGTFISATLDALSSLLLLGMATMFLI